jgi:hypothetical protein
MINLHKRIQNRRQDRAREVNKKVIQFFGDEKSEERMCVKMLKVL